MGQTLYFILERWHNVFCMLWWSMWFRTLFLIMIPFLLTASSFLNFAFYIYGIGFVVALIFEQWLKNRPLSVDASMNERNMYIVQTNRKYCWRQAWVVNLLWFMCNIGLYLASRNMQTPVDTFWQGLWRRKNQKKESMLRIEWNTLESSIELLHQLWS